VSCTLATQSRSAFVHRVLERAAPLSTGAHFRTQQLHPEHIGRLPFNVARTHIDDAGQAEARADGGSGNAMLASAGLGNDARLAHPDGEQNLADAVVDLVRAGVVELVALEPDLRAFARPWEPSLAPRTSSVRRSA
jgi:hypothetical protein